jgi:hypothetical protein
MTQAFRRTYSFSERASFRAWRKYPAATPNSTHIELWDAPEAPRKEFSSDSRQNHWTPPIACVGWIRCHLLDTTPTGAAPNPTPLPDSQERHLFLPTDDPHSAPQTATSALDYPRRCPRRHQRHRSG